MRLKLFEGPRETHSLLQPEENTENKTRSNFGSIFSSIGKLPGFVGDAYWLGLLIDALFGLDPDVLGLSKAGLISGCALSVFSTFSSVYCGYKINTNANNPDFSNNTSAKLSAVQKMMLLGYLLDQAGDKASSLGLVAHVIFGDSLGRWPRAAMQVSAALFGGATSYAELVTATINLKRSTSSTPSTPLVSHGF